MMKYYLCGGYPYSGSKSSKKSECREFFNEVMEDITSCDPSASSDSFINKDELSDMKSFYRFTTPTMADFGDNYRRGIKEFIENDLDLVGSADKMIIHIDDYLDPYVLFRLGYYLSIDNLGSLVWNMKSLKDKIIINKTTDKINKALKVMLSNKFLNNFINKFDPNINEDFPNMGVISIGHEAEVLNNSNKFSIVHIDMTASETSELSSMSRELAYMIMGYLYHSAIPFVPSYKDYTDQDFTVPQWVPLVSFAMTKSNVKHEWSPEGFVDLLLNDLGNRGYLHYDEEHRWDKRH